MKLTGRRWNMVCLALLGVLLFSSCASSPQGTAQTASADSSAEEQTAPASRVRTKKSASLNDILSENVQRIVSLSVVRAENENYSIWLLLVQAQDEE